MDDAPADTRLPPGAPDALATGRGHLLHARRNSHPTAGVFFTAVAAFADALRPPALRADALSPIFMEEYRPRSTLVLFVSARLVK
jgi:hypothetical protein